jgi:hypothetical protein
MILSNQSESSTLLIDKNICKYRDLYILKIYILPECLLAKKLKCLGGIANAT